jgi:hypothetical protein
LDILSLFCPIICYKRLKLVKILCGYQEMKNDLEKFPARNSTTAEVFPSSMGEPEA